jgi:2-dehydropantoate 2-reductase
MRPGPPGETRALTGHAARVAVIGAGAVGTCVAWNLVRAGHDVTVCVRQKIDRLVLRKGDGEPSAVPVTAVTDPAAVGTQDWLLVATKAQDTASARPWLDAAAGPGTVIVLLQNGIDHAGRLGDAGQEATIVPALVFVNAEPLGPGQAWQRTGDEIAVPAGEAAARLAGLFAGSEIRIRPEPDFRAAAWRKLLANAAHNPILALTGRRADAFTEPDILTLAAGLVSEAVTVAAAEGIDVSEKDVPGIVSGLGALPAGAGNSMLFDRLRGRALESEFITGAIVEAGRRAAIPTPLNDAVLALLRAASRSAAPSAPHAPRAD